MSVYKDKSKRIALLILDTLMALFWGILFTLKVLIDYVFLKKQDEPSANKKLLVIDCDYTLYALRKRNQLASIFCRDLEGYFEHVWSVHPFATFLYDQDHIEEYGSLYGDPVTHKLNQRHTFVEGRVGALESLENFQLLNFILAQWRLYKYLRRLIHTEGISVIRVNDPFYDGLLSHVLGKVTRTPVLLRLGSNYEMLYQTVGKPVMKSLFRNVFIERKVCKFLIRRFDCVAAVNEDNKRFAISYGVNPKKITLFRYGNLIDKKHFLDPKNRPDGSPFLRALGFADEEPFALCVSRLEQLKYPDHCIRALRKLHEEGMPLKLILAGDGSMKKELIDLAESLEVSDFVIFANEVDQDDLFSILPKASLVLSPMTGRALTEAALAAVPIVGYDIDWQYEVLINGETGELVPSLDLDAFSKACIRILNDDVYSQKLSTNVRKHILEMMDHRKLDDHERSVYSKLISKNF